MKNLLRILLFLLPAAIFGVSCEKNVNEPDAGSEYTFPEHQSVTIEAGGSYAMFVDCPSAFSVSLPNTMNFYLTDEDGQERSLVDYPAGKSAVTVCAREITNFSEDIVETLTMTVGDRSQAILTVTLKKQMRELTIYKCTYDYESDMWSNAEDAYKDAVGVDEPLTFVFNKSHDAWELYIRIDCDFPWGYKTGNIDWIDEESLSTQPSDPKVRRLTLVPGKLNLDGMSGQLTFTAAVNSTETIDVATYTFEVPSSRDICYGYTGSDYIGVWSSLSFGSDGTYNDSNSTGATSVSGALVGSEDTHLVLVGQTENGDGWEICADNGVTMGEWSSEQPNLKRSFTYAAGENPGYNRTMWLVAVNGETPADLVGENGVAEKYEASIVAMISHSGKLGRADGAKLTFIEGQLWGIQLGEAAALEHGLKFDLLEDDDVANTIRQALDIEKLEVWRMTFKCVTYRDEDTGFVFSPTFWGCFYFSGYENAGLAFDQNETVNGELGLTQPMGVSPTVSTQTTPHSCQFDITPSDPSSRDECVVIVYLSDEEGEPSTAIAALHMVYDPSAEF